MKRVTRDIDPASAQDLLERVPRACLSFAGDEGPQVEPVLFVLRDGRYLVGISVDAGRRPDGGQEVVVLIDEGVLFFDLRGISIRGRVTPCGAPAGAADRRTWFEVAPERTAAWDYATLRVASDGS